MRVYCILFYTRLLHFIRVYMRGLMPRVLFAFAHACHTRGPFKLWVICTIHIQILEKVQRRAARWVLSDYGRQSSITRMLTQLGWLILQHHHFISRLICFTNCSPDHSILFFINTVSYQYHSKHFIFPSNSTTTYQKSCYPRTIRDWKELPSSSIETTDVELLIE